MEVELALMGWMMAEDRKVFQKKEIVDKYNELWESEKKTLTMDRLMKMLEKFKMWNVIIRDRKGVEHFLRYDMNSSIATLVKREEVSLEISREPI
jgi:transcriptional regulator of NAD metabolism